jgi:hypothetical protein
MKPKAGLFSIQINPFEIPALISVVARCGGYDQGFEAEIEVTTNDLDSDGFVVHNEKLVEAIRNMFGKGNIEGIDESLDEPVVWRASCEQLTAGIAHVIINMIPLERLEVIHVKVFNHLGHTSIDWIPSDAIPEFPRRATEDEIAETIRQNKAAGRESRC